MLAEFEAFDVIYLQAGIVQQRQGSSHPFSSDPEAFDVTYLQVEARPLTQDLVMHRLPLRLLMPIAVTLLMTGMGPEAMIAGPMGGSTPHERRVMTGLVHTLCCKTRTEVIKAHFGLHVIKILCSSRGFIKWCNRPHAYQYVPL